MEGLCEILLIDLPCTFIVNLLTLSLEIKMELRRFYVQTKGKASETDAGLA